MLQVLQILLDVNCIFISDGCKVEYLGWSWFLDLLKFQFAQGYKELVVAVAIYSMVGLGIFYADLPFDVNHDVVDLISAVAFWLCPSVYTSWVLLKTSVADNKVIGFAEINHIIASLISDTQLKGRFFGL